MQVKWMCYVNQGKTNQNGIMITIIIAITSMFHHHVYIYLFLLMMSCPLMLWRRENLSCTQLLLCAHTNKLGFYFIFLDSHFENPFPRFVALLITIIEAKHNNHHIYYITFYTLFTENVLFLHTTG